MKLNMVWAFVLSHKQSRDFYNEIKVSEII